jgi:DnaJ-class molecular chaperone
MILQTFVFRFKRTCDWCHGSGKILEIVEHRGGWVKKPRRCDKCNGFGQIE